MPGHWQLVHAGLAGGPRRSKTITEPSRIRDADGPSFGAVHAVTSRSCCRPGPRGLCSHGKPIRCARRHADGDLSSASRCASIVTTTWTLCSRGTSRVVAPIHDLASPAVVVWLRSRNADPKAARVSLSRSLRCNGGAAAHPRCRAADLWPRPTSASLARAAGLVITEDVGGVRRPSAGGEVRTVRFVSS